MTSYKEIFGLIATVLGVIGYIPYVRDTFRGKTKPHAFTWLIWVILAGISFYAQFVEGGGAGGWLIAVTGSLSFLIFILSLFKGVKQFARFDWLCLLGAGLAIAAWVITGNPFAAVILVVIVDIFGLMPLLRHSYLKPGEETSSMFGIYFFAWVFSLLALQIYNPTTTLYIAYNVITNPIIVAVILVRRTQLKKNPTLSDMRERANEALAQRKEEHFKKIEAYVREKGSIDNEAVRQLLGVSQSTATRYLADLAADGKLKAENNARSTIYRL